MSLDLPEELEDVALEMYSILADDENHPAVGNYSQRCVAAGIIYLAAESTISNSPSRNTTSLMQLMLLR